MKKNIKIVMTLMLLVITMFASASVANAAGENFGITKVTINGDKDFTTFGSNAVYAPVQIGDKIDVAIEWEAVSNFSTDGQDAKIRVDFEGDSVSSDKFLVKNNYARTEKLSFKIANDEDLIGQTLPMDITMRLNNGEEKKVTIYLTIDRARNNVQIYDVNFGKGLQTDAGKLLTASVGVSNEGDKKESDVYVVMSIPELGLMTRSDRFDLVTKTFADSSAANDNDYNKLHKELSLEVPSNTKPGVYDLHFEVFYNNGNSKDEQVYSLVVGSGAASSDITMDTKAQTVEAGKAIVYKVMFDNNADYTVKVDGLNFGTYEVRKEAGVAYVFVSAKEDAKEGNYNFTVSVNSGDKEVQKFDVTTKVIKAGSSNVNYSDVRQGLEIGFAVLLIILVILGIILVAKRLGKGNEMEEPAVDEDQTYY